MVALLNVIDSSIIPGADGLWLRAPMRATMGSGGVVAERALFEDFVVQRSPRLLRLCFLLTRDHAAAEDLLQVALAEAWLAWTRLDDDPEAYVRRIVVHEFTSARRRRRRRRGELPAALAPEPRPVGGQGTEDPTPAVDERDRLWAALGRLPRRRRAVVVLRFYEDLSEQQTARALGISIGTVRSQAGKAFGALRLDPDLAAEPGGPPLAGQWGSGGSGPAQEDVVSLDLDDGQDGEPAGRKLRWR